MASEPSNAELIEAWRQSNAPERLDTAEAGEALRHRLAEYGSVGPEVRHWLRAVASCPDCVICRQHAAERLADLPDDGGGA